MWLPNAKFRIFCCYDRDLALKFTADMATAWRKVKGMNNFYTRDLLKVYYGQSDYAKYDHAVCQWNHLKGFLCR